MATRRADNVSFTIGDADDAAQNAALMQLEGKATSKRQCLLNILKGERRQQYHIVQATFARRAAIRECLAR